MTDKERFKDALEGLAKQAENAARLLMGDEAFEAERAKQDAEMAGMTNEQKREYFAKLAKGD